MIGCQVIMQQVTSMVECALTFDPLDRLRSDPDLHTEGKVTSDQLLKESYGCEGFFIFSCDNVQIIDTNRHLQWVCCWSTVVSSEMLFWLYLFSLSSRFSSQMRTLNLLYKGQQSLSLFWRADIRSSIPTSGFWLIHVNPLHLHWSQTLTWTLSGRGHCESKREMYQECSQGFFWHNDPIADLQLNRLHINTVRPEWLLWIDGWGIGCRLESQGSADNKGSVWPVGNLTTQPTGFFDILLKHEWGLCGPYVLYNWIWGKWTVPNQHVLPKMSWSDWSSSTDYSVLILLVLVHIRVSYKNTAAVLSSYQQ